MLSDAHLIYGLYDVAESRVVRYVGKTKYPDARTRLQEHERGARHGERSRKAAWIRSVWTNKSTVGVSVIAVATSRAEANHLERHFIRVFRERGVPLTNLTDGGDGGAAFTGRRHTKETLAKISTALRGRPRAAEASAKTAAALRGRKLSPSHAAALRAAHIGAKRSEETKNLIRVARAKQRSSLAQRAALSERMKGEANPFFGKTHSEEARKRMGAGGRSSRGRKLSEEHKAKILAGRRAFFARRGRAS